MTSRASEHPGETERHRPSLLVPRLLVLLFLWTLALRVWLAWPGAGPSRFWDERYSFWNVRAFLDAPSLKPDNGYYPTLSFLPEALVLTAFERVYDETWMDEIRVRDEREFPTPFAYHVCRAMRCFYGACCILLTYIVGRRVKDARTGLLAAFFLAANVYHVRMSVEFKPESLVWLLLLVAFYLMIRAIERPTLGAYLLAGAAVGAATSAKWNAPPIAIVLVLGTLLYHRQDRRAAAVRLVAAGSVALAVFFLLQPWLLLDPSVYNRDVSAIVRHYDEAGAHATGGRRLPVLWHFLRAQPGAEFFGPVVGALALAGLAVTLARAVASALGTARTPMRPAVVLCLVAVLGQVAAFTLVSTNPTHHNWLLVAPELAILAALLAFEMGERAVGRFPALARAGAAPAWALGGAAALAIAGLAYPANAYVYASVVPRTTDLAVEWLTSRVVDPAGRIVLTEVELPWAARPREPDTRPAILRVDRLDHEGRGALDLADAEVFAERPALGPGEAQVHAAFVAARRSRVDAGSVRSFRSRLFVAQGEPVVALVHPLERAGEEGTVELLCPGDGGIVCRGDLPRGLARGDLVSLAFDAGANEEPAELTIGEARHETAVYGMTAKNRRLDVVSRVRLTGTDVTLTLAGPPAIDCRMLTAWPWRDPRTGAVAVDEAAFSTAGPTDAPRAP